MLYKQLEQPVKQSKIKNKNLLKHNPLFKNYPYLQLVQTVAKLEFM